MGRWHVYEFMKNTYIETGVIPSLREVYRRFSSQFDLEEIGEGMIEFYLAFPKFKELRKFLLDEEAI